MKLKAITYLFTLFCISLSASTLAQADSNFSLRARPFALATATYGLEGFYMTDSGYFIGSTFHYFLGNNNEKLTALQNYEYGIKFGKLFQSKAPNQGWFLMGNINSYSTTVAQYNSNSATIFQAKLSQIGEAIFGGYQWNASLIGSHWDLRLGLGIAYKPEKIIYFDDTAGNLVPVGVRKRLDPTLEFTMGYVF